MRIGKIKIILSIFLIFLGYAVLSAQPSLSRNNLFDNDWRFFKGGVLGAENPGYDDSAWREIDLPHDWSIEDLPHTQSPFDPAAISQSSGGFTTGGTGWYRKTFTIPDDLQGKRIIVQFDGVYMNADVWLNGRQTGTHPYGYTGFIIDLTGFVNFGGKNVLTVKVKNEGENSRWYSGSGIFRHVWLQVLEPTHIAQWGVYITSTVKNSTTAGAVVKTSIINESGAPANIKLVTILKNPKGKESARVETEKEINANETTIISQDAEIISPELWSPDSPALYNAVTTVFQNKKLVDSSVTRFGIRTLKYDPQNGFSLNGQVLKLKGGCVHHDNGPLGAKAFDRAEERRVELLKASGFNAIRCAHNPPSPAFLDACDRLGMLVIDEAFDMWDRPKNPFDYHLYFNEWWKKDMESMIFRDRNHPSIIMWSIGNEIPGMNDPLVVKTANMLAQYARELDNTRPITAAVNDINDKKDPFFAALDIAGYNYGFEKFKEDKERVPDRIIAATESSPLLAFQSWMGVVDNPYVIGDFVWTSFDYIGEASIGWRGYWADEYLYPWNLAYCGDLDICGWKRPQSFYRDALWNIEPNVSIFATPPEPTFPFNPKKEEWSKWNWDDVVADWNWAGYENKPMDLVVYSNCEMVELFLNGKSLGKKAFNRSTEFKAVWQAPYQPGVVKAIGFAGKKQVTVCELRTTGEPVKMTLTADRNEIKADGQDLSYITVELCDENNVRNPKAENLVEFIIEGPGEIIAVGNGKPTSLESYQLPQRQAWQGRCLVIVKSTQQSGIIHLTAKSKGLPEAEMNISVK